MAQAIPWQDRVIPEPNSGCLLWEGACADGGYGKVTRGGKQFRVTHLAWEERNGPVPEGLFVLHRCDVPSCCNVEHLFLGTAGDNARDMAAKGRVGGGSPRKLTCKFGHFLDEETAYIKTNGDRRCRICARDYLRQWYSRKARNG